LHLTEALPAATSAWNGLTGWQLEPRRLAAGIAFGLAVLSPDYAGPRRRGLDPLSDQQGARLAVWIPGDLIFAGGWLAPRLASLEQEDRREARYPV
jgi:hypothetical protein